MTDRELRRKIGLSFDLVRVAARRDALGSPAITGNEMVGEATTLLADTIKEYVDNKIKQHVYNNE